MSGFRATGAKYFLPFFLGQLAEAQLYNGDFDGAMVTLAEALGIEEQEAYQPFLLWLRGEVNLRNGAESQAEADFREAMSLADGQGGILYQLRATNSLARLIKSHGESSAARDLIAPVYSRFTEGFDTADLKDAKALLDELNG